MKGRILAVAITLMVVLSLFVTGQPVRAGIQPVVAIDHVFTALNSGELDAAVDSFAESAMAENKVRSQMYHGANEIRGMLQEMGRAGREFEIVSVEMYADTITAQVELSDRGIVWATETIQAELKGGKLQTFQITAIRLQL